MGWWGYEPLAGDTPLDLLAVLPDTLGVDQPLDVYPDGALTDTERAAVHDLFAAMAADDAHRTIDDLTRRAAPGDTAEFRLTELAPIAWQVLAVVWMASGAPMPGEVKDAIRQAITNDPWGLEEDQQDGGPAGRRAALDQLAAQVDRYQTGPTATPSRTLFGALRQATDVDRGPLNVGPETYRRT